MNLNQPATPHSLDLHHAKQKNVFDGDVPTNAEPNYDARFMGRLRDRDPEAFDELVRNEGARIGQLVSRLMGWNSDCDDIVQDVFVDAWESVSRFRGDSKITTWLYSIAVNRCRNKRRGLRIWNTCYEIVCEKWNSKHKEQPTNQHETNIDDVHQAMKNLGQRDREIVVLVCLENVPLARASEMLGIRQNTLEVRLHRARQRLKQLLHVENK